MMTNRSVLHIMVSLLAIFYGYNFVSSPPRANLPVVPENSPTKTVPSWFIVKPMLLLNTLFRAGVRATTLPKDHVMELATSYFQSEVVYMLVNHQIFDALEKEPRQCEQVSQLLDLKSHIVCEFMKAGHRLGLLAVGGVQQEYSLTESGKLLHIWTKISDVNTLQ